MIDEAIIMPPTERHIPVMAGEVVTWLLGAPACNEAGWILDGTLGMGGHAEMLLEAAPPQMRLIAMDRDESAVDRALERLRPHRSRIAAYCGSYSDFEDALFQEEVRQLSGVLLDLGLSSDQLDTPERGFGFDSDQPLDLRFDPTDGDPAWAILRWSDETAIRKILHEYGEEPLAGPVARELKALAQREGSGFSAKSAAAAVARVYGRRFRQRSRRHPATRTFQALRIHVNRELEQLEAFLGRISTRLTVGARVVVISYHSLEDRLVKRAFRDGKMLGEYDVLTNKPLLPTEEELADNPRARSAKMRVAERIQGGAQ